MIPSVTNTTKRSAVTSQRRFQEGWVGKAAPDTHWRYLVHRKAYDNYYAGEIIDEDRIWERRGLTSTMYRQIMQHRWQDSPDAPRVDKSKWKLFIGDIVEVTEGKDKGHRGTITDIFYSANKVKVTGARMINQEGRDPATGQSLPNYVPDWMGAHEIRVIDPQLDQPVDIEWMELEHPVTGEVERTRVSKATGVILPLPPKASEASENEPGASDGAKDTSTEAAQQITLEDSTISGEMNQMALVKLKSLENWFVGELEGLHTKDKKLRDNLAAEKKEFQYYTYQLALEKVMQRVETEEPWLMEEVARMRAESRPAPGKMPDFTADQELYREIRRGARFQLKHDRRPMDTESLYDRWTRTTQSGTKLEISKQIRLRFEQAALSIRAKQTGKKKAQFKLSSTFRMKPLEYIQDALETEAAMREKMEIDQGEAVQKEVYVGWKPQVDRRRDELDTFENRFGHMKDVMEENHAAAEAEAEAVTNPEGDLLSDKPETP